MNRPPWVFAAIATFGACAFLFGCAERKQFWEQAEMDRTVYAVPYDYDAGKKP